MTEVSRAGRESGLRDVVVMKFGGTSVEDAAAFRRVAAIVRSRMPERPVVVVSALAKVTDQLLSAAQAAAERKLDYSNAVLSTIRLRHREIAADLLIPEDYGRLWQEFDAELRSLNSAICELAVSGQLTPRAQDAVLSCGERLSSKLAAALLCAHQIDAVHFDSASAIVTDSRHTAAEPLWDATSERVAKGLAPLLQSGQVPVMGGYIASTVDGVPTTLGRGGSDLTASIVGAALGAARVEIWTDVGGIMTTDPNICPDAKPIPQMSFEDAAELAHAGAKVLHPATLVPAMRCNIPVHVLNSRNPISEGTKIVADVNPGNSMAAVTMRRNVVAIDIELHDAVAAESLGRVYAAFDQYGCAVELLAAARCHLSLLVDSAAALPKIAAELRGLASLTWENHKALVSLIGSRLRHEPELAGRVLAAVSDLEVRVLGQGGGSERRFSFLVKEAQAEDCLRRLHALLFCEPGQDVAPRFNSAALCQAGESWL